MHQIDRLREKIKNSLLPIFAVEYFGHQGEKYIFIVRGSQEGSQAEFLALIHMFTVRTPSGLICIHLLLHLLVLLLVLYFSTSFFTCQYSYWSYISPPSSSLVSTHTGLKYLHLLLHLLVLLLVLNISTSFFTCQYSYQS